MVKFWLHVSEEEQLKRCQKRESDPLKQWKLTDDDWKNRAKRPLYLEALEDVFARTDQPQAPWQLVEGESKRYARVKVIETVNAEIERGMRERDFPVPRQTT
jgi:AMP-polyphosphate phosphotransferase